MITEAATDAERAEVQALFEQSFHDIDPAAVPMSKSDHLYAPLILRLTDEETGALAGAALTCRAQLVAALSMSRLRLPGMPDVDKIKDKHSELDLMAVRPEYRGRGFGTALVEAMEQRLRARGVRVWFGNVTPDLDAGALRRFYARRGFDVGAPGQMLPPLLGTEWYPKGAPPTAFYFWRTL